MIPPYQSIDILLGKPARAEHLPILGFVVCNASPIFEYGTKCVRMFETQEEAEVIKAATDHFSKWASIIRPCWIHTEDGRRSHTPR